MYNLLLADDEPLIRRGIKSIAALSEIGIDSVFETENALSALSVIEHEHIDIIFLDINMPDMDGLTLAGTIRKGFPDIRIVMITGYDYFDYMQTAIRIGVDDYLMKPVSRADIEQVLRRVIEKLCSLNIDRKLRELGSAMKNLSLPVGSLQSDTETGTLFEYVHTHIFDTDFSLSSTADALGFNKSYLSSVLKKIYGIPFQEYVGLRRMEQAKLLLLSQDLRNTEIAQAIGYEDVNYFVSKFKKTYQLSPKQFRQGVLKNEI